MARLYLLAATVNVWVLVLLLTAAFAFQFIAGEPLARSASCSASR
jgi:hypothetical protein